MSVSGIDSVTSVSVNSTAANGDSAAVETKGSTATKLTEQQNGGTAAKTAQSTSQTNDLAKLKMYASQHMSASQIAQRLGKSVSAVMQEAAAAGITLDTGSTGSSSSAAKGNPAVGNNVNTTA